MKKKYALFLGAVVIVAVMAGDVRNLGAEIQLTECLTMSGFLRHEVGLHIAPMNPNNAAFQDDNNDLNLSRTFLQTEFTYKPSELFKLFANVRITGDQTYSLDDEIGKYDAFPVDVPEADWTMMKASSNSFRAEVWELYADFNFGDGWLRLGKQQIVWGELIGARILDAANSLDRSWNFLFELEEFDLIRIPNWSIRGSYNIKQNALSWLKDLNIEAFLNPGDVVPTINAEPGAPFRLFAYPAFFRINEEDQRGKQEYGARIGGLIGQAYGTLNFIRMYNDDAIFRFTGLTPDPVNGIPLRIALGDRTRYAMLLRGEHKLLNLFGMSLNYAFADPFNLVMTFEGAWIPEKPYSKAGVARPDMEEQGTWDYAIKLDRPTQVIPPSFLHASFMTLQLQFRQTVVEGNEDDILGGNNSKIDKSVQQITFQVKQPLMYNNLTLGFQVIYDTDDAYLVKPSISYRYRDHWYFDVFSVTLGGSEKRPGRFGSTDWADTCYMRATYQF
jgi:hypothetical protein